MFLCAEDWTLVKQAKSTILPEQCDNALTLEWKCATCLDQIYEMNVGWRENNSPQVNQQDIFQFRNADENPNCDTECQKQNVRWNCQIPTETFVEVLLGKSLSHIQEKLEFTVNPYRENSAGHTGPQKVHKYIFNICHCLNMQSFVFSLKFNVNKKFLWTKICRFCATNALLMYPGCNISNVAFLVEESSGFKNVFPFLSGLDRKNSLAQGTSNKK